MPITDHSHYVKARATPLREHPLIGGEGGHDAIADYLRRANHPALQPAASPARRELTLADYAAPPPYPAPHQPA